MGDADASFSGSLQPGAFLQGEFLRSLDERYRLTLPPELVEGMLGASEDALLVKERPGCLSLWPLEAGKTQLRKELAVVQSKLAAGLLGARLSQVQTLGRLFSTRQKEIKLAGRGRLVLPEGFREFLRVEPTQEVVVIGAAVCIELWHQTAWQTHLGRQIPRFRKLLTRLSE